MTNAERNARRRAKQARKSYAASVERKPKVNIASVMRQDDVQFKRDAKHAHALPRKWKGMTGHRYPTAKVKSEPSVMAKRNGKSYAELSAKPIGGFIGNVE